MLQKTLTKIGIDEEIKIFEAEIQEWRVKSYIYLNNLIKWQSIYLGLSEDNKQKVIHAYERCLKQGLLSADEIYFMRFIQLVVDSDSFKENSDRGELPKETFEQLIGWCLAACENDLFRGVDFSKLSI